MATKEDADKVRADLVANKLTWEQAAKQYNLDPNGREKGTDMGWHPLTQMDPDMRAILQRDGDLSQPISYQGQWNLIRRIAYRPQGRPPFEQVQDEVRQRLIMSAAQAKLEALHNLADIKRLGDYKAPGQ